MWLTHLSLPRIVSYRHVSKIQDNLVAKLLAHKAHPSSTPPNPAIVTAEFKPVYACGRREVGHISASQQAFLRDNGRAEFVEALRGGQTTFHGPGQMVAYPVIDLKRHGISPREYVCLLEKAVIATCARWGIKGITTENPGVWVSEESKIAALGVHLRRNVSSHGVAINVNTDLWWFERIVACGLEGKKTTSFEQEGVANVSVGDVAAAFVEEFGKSLGIEETQVRIID
ncbi:lipoyl(octanoyl) transferase [Coniosporium apollinis CBS 100218]|uniref:Octanoyltransferase n=1 Tax=Coniosporium apollinis (strain CBS 100218) TaxID=1168221 RepID=R7YWS7_CONA1|nr:lipoyl(octanoyl) transferase [Coniosporium apollinis CBS 100218]EON66298.1 lipoyl(octanoyl) transferase [Coniosporium apollinis CBS 100218]